MICKASNLAKNSPKIESGICRDSPKNLAQTHGCFIVLLVQKRNYTSAKFFKGLNSKKMTILKHFLTSKHNYMSAEFFPRDVASTHGHFVVLYGPKAKSYKCRIFPRICHKNMTILKLMNSALSLALILESVNP